MPLEDLPTELLVIIFGLVCLADIDSEAHACQTTYSLCLVSRNFYSLAVPILYRTLIVDGRSKTVLLSRTLQTRPELAACAVHLFLSDRGRHSPSFAHGDDSGESALEVLPTFAFEFPRSQEGRVERLQRMQLWLSARAQTLATFRSAIQHILDVVSPHLRTFAICLYGYYDRSADSGLATALEHSFPSLVELTVRDNSNPQPCAQLELPALKRLHLAGGSLPHPFDMLGGLVEGCPRLKYIRLTEPFVNDAAVSALELILAKSPDARRFLRSSSRKASTSPRRLGDILERFVLVSCPYLIVSEARSTSHPGVCEKLAALAARSEVFEGTYVNRKPEDQYPFEDALRDWRDCVAGREGCWRSK